MSQEHLVALSQHCRVCGSRFKNRKGPQGRKFSCSDRHDDLLDDLLEVFGINVQNDSEATHPKAYCHSCNNIIYHTHKKAQCGKEYNPHKVIAPWLAHSDNNCSVCESSSTPNLGGRPKNQFYTPGRPAKGSFNVAIGHIKLIAPPTFCQQEKVIPPHDVFDCPICMEIVDKPIELVCGTLVCADCLCQCLRVSKTTSCPCCHLEHLDDLDSIQPPSEITLKALGNMEVKCSNCKKLGKLEHHKAHIDSLCGTQNFKPAPLSASDLLNRHEGPLSPLEEQVQSSLIQHSLRNSHILEVKTKGKPRTLIQISSPRVSSGAASQTTLRRRSSELLAVRTKVSGGEEVVQLSNEVKMVGKEDREKLVEELKRTSGCFRVEFSVVQSLGIQSVLMIPSNKLRIMKRMLGPNIKIASEKKMRAEAASLAGVDNLRSQLVPFTFPLKDGRHTVEIKNVPMCYTPSLWKKIGDMLNFNDDTERRVHRLTWHEGRIPDDEIWVKLGGDKGGGSFKMSFQICNVDHPNSTENTCAFCVFEAPDNATNLKIGLERFQDEVDSLPSKTWRGKTVRVFLSGDYEFLCHMYGLSGASGRHCCLWCLITSDELKSPPTNAHQSRTTDSILGDHQSFIAAGGKLNKAKLFNNCVREPFFKSIPLNQVCPPGLHITLGIFYRLFQLMEDDCHELDVAIREEEDSREKGGPSYSHYMSDFARARTLKDELDRANEEVTQLNDLVALLVVFREGEEEEEDPQLQDLRSELEGKAVQAHKLDIEWTKASAIVEKGFKKEDGPFVKALDQALDAFNVRRQAYHSGSFVGNHVHRTLEPKHTRELCDALVLAAANYRPAIVQRAEKLQRKYSVVFTLYNNCYTLFNKPIVTDEDIACLDTHISIFMDFYRHQFPHATVIPKMHMLESHVVEWLREWKVGLGLMGEQGAESIHNYFNNLKVSYRNISNDVDRLRCMMKQHFVHIAPSNVACRPPPVKRRKINKT